MSWPTGTDIQLQGGFAPLASPEALPLDPRWGLRPKTPVIRSRSALAMSSRWCAVRFATYFKPENNTSPTTIVLHVRVDRICTIDPRPKAVCGKNHHGNTTRNFVNQYVIGMQSQGLLSSSAPCNIYFRLLIRALLAVPLKHETVFFAFS